jgi:hypothetical protein
MEVIVVIVFCLFMLPVLSVLWPIILIILPFAIIGGLFSGDSKDE